MPCREASRRLASGELERGSFPSKLPLLIHLLSCGACKRFLRQLRMIALAARKWTESLGERDAAFAAELERKLS